MNDEAIVQRSIEAFTQRLEVLDEILGFLEDAENDFSDFEDDASTHILPATYFEVKQDAITMANEKLVNIGVKPTSDVKVLRKVKEDMVSHLHKLQDLKQKLALFSYAPSE